MPTCRDPNVGKGERGSLADVRIIVAATNRDATEAMGTQCVELYPEDVAQKNWESDNGLITMKFTDDKKNVNLTIRAASGNTVFEETAINPEY